MNDLIMAVLGAMGGGVGGAMLHANADKIPGVNKLPPKALPVVPAAIGGVAAYFGAKEKQPILMGLGFGLLGYAAVSGFAAFGNKELSIGPGGAKLAPGVAGALLGASDYTAIVGAGLGIDEMAVFSEQVPSETMAGVGDKMDVPVLAGDNKTNVPVLAGTMNNTYTAVAGNDYTAIVGEYRNAPVLAGGPELQVQTMMRTNQPY